MLTSSQQEFLKSVLSRARLRRGIQPRSNNTTNRVAADQRSGPGPDVRDPATLAMLIDHLIVTRGWDLNIVAGKVKTLWPALVGDDIANHVQIETLDLASSGSSGVLVLRAESTAWATQIRLMLSTIEEKIDAEFGSGTITEIKVLGPTAPSWKHGLRSVSGRGPRDTYG
ncbi:MAG: DUF721 domain-containing protein [Actinobacteria bacterium]|nr:DUF721 domain-containing protein [Actinomycetota bacterium]